MQPAHQVDANCPTELTSSSPDSNVFRAYDILYMFSPFSQAFCTKGDDWGYCVLEVAPTLKTCKNLLTSSGSDPTFDLRSTVAKNSHRDGRVVVPDLQRFGALDLALLTSSPPMANSCCASRAPAMFSTCTFSFLTVTRPRLTHPQLICRDNQLCFRGGKNRYQLCFAMAKMALLTLPFFQNHS